MSKEDQIENCVQQLRKGQKVTQEELAEILGVTRQTIIAIEKGNYAPSIILALKIAHHFNVPVEDVFNFAYEK